MKVKQYALIYRMSIKTILCDAHVMSNRSIQEACYSHKEKCAKTCVYALGSSHYTVEMPMANVMPIDSSCSATHAHVYYNIVAHCAPKL